MKRHRLLCRVLAASAAALLLTGCGDSKKAREARMTGIEQMNQENYEDAIASFDKALDEADGIVGPFELDVLKYRAEAEYLTEDYRAAAHTYDILADVDGGKREYLYYGAASHALAGELDKAVEAYEKAQKGASGEKKQDQLRNRQTGRKRIRNRKTKRLQMERSRKPRPARLPWIRIRSPFMRPLFPRRRRRAALWPCRPSERPTRIRDSTRKP